MTAIAQQRRHFGYRRLHLTTTHDHTRSSDGRRRLSSHSPAIRAGIWRCAMPKAPRQLPSLPPPSRANPTARANSELDKTWGQGHWLGEGKFFPTSIEDHLRYSDNEVMAALWLLLGMPGRKGIFTPSGSSR